MTEKKAKKYTDFVLPPSVVTRVDVSRLVSELEAVDNQMTDAAARGKSGGEKPHRPVLSDQLNDFLQENDLLINTGVKRTALIREMRHLKDKVPVIHMTFAVTADPESLSKLAEWLRASIHPQAVISVGLQPAIVAGVYLRTPNHVHDLSLKSKLEGSHDLMLKELEAIRGK